MTGEAIAPALLPKDAIPIWVSEAMVDLYGYTLGKRVTLPIASFPARFRRRRRVARLWAAIRRDTDAAGRLSGAVGRQQSERCRALAASWA